MALLICPDCGKEVSSRALSCPHCGCPAEFFESDVVSDKDILDICDKRGQMQSVDDQISVSESVEKEESVGTQDLQDRNQIIVESTASESTDAGTDDLVVSSNGINQNDSNTQRDEDLPVEMVFCMECGVKISITEEYCRYCGAKNRLYQVKTDMKESSLDLKQENIITVSEEKQSGFCIQCGEKIQKTMAFCPNCGSKNILH